MSSVKWHRLSDVIHSEENGLSVQKDPMQVKRPKAETSPVGSKPVPAHLGDNLENDSTPTIYLLKNWSCEIEIRHYGREPRLVLVGTLVNPPANIEPALVAQWRSSPVQVRFDDRTVATIGRTTYRLIGPTKQNPPHPIFCNGVPKIWHHWLRDIYMVQTQLAARARAKVFSAGGTLPATAKDGQYMPLRNDEGPEPAQPPQYVPGQGQVRKIHLSMLKLPPAPLGIFYELTRDYHTCVADERVNIYAPDGKLLVALIPGAALSYNTGRNFAFLQGVTGTSTRRGAAGGLWTLSQLLDDYYAEAGDFNVKMDSRRLGATTRLGRDTRTRVKGEWSGYRQKVPVSSTSFPNAQRPVVPTLLARLAELGTLVLGAEFPEITDIHMHAVGKAEAAGNIVTDLRGCAFNRASTNLFQAATHKDIKDAEHTYSFMFVFGDRCCWLMFPDYGVAVRTRPGDAVVFNGREATHCNSPLEGIEMPDNYKQQVSLWKDHRASVALYVKE